MSTRIPHLLSISLLALAVCLLGCSPETKEPGDKGGEPKEEAHSHDIGPNGGPLAVTFDHKYHVELLADHDAGTITLLVTDAKFKPVAIEEDVIHINVNHDGENTRHELAKKADTPEGEPCAFTLAAEELAELIAHKEVEKIELSTKLNKVPYKNSFALGEHEDHGDHDEDGDHDKDGDGHDEDEKEGHDEDGDDHDKDGDDHNHGTDEDKD